MQGTGLFRVIRVSSLFLALAVVGQLLAAEQPEWDFEILDCEKADFEAHKLHAKEAGDWLLTFRMRVKSLNLIPPISKIEFEGKVEAESEEDEDKVVWTKSYTIRRNKFEAAYGGGRSQFVRVFLKDVPNEVTLVEMSYLKEEEPEEE